MIKYWIFAVGLLVSCGEIQGEGLPSQKVSIPLWELVLDAKDSKTLPRHFRTMRDSHPENCETSGLLSLNMSGSGQFSVLQFKAFLDYVENFGFSPQQVVVVDLREEPHAFINGDAFMWYARKAWWTQNEPVAFVVENEKNRLAALSLGQPVILKYVAQKDEAGDVRSLTDRPYVINSLMTEEQVVRQAGAHYYRVPVTDHMRPDDKDVDQFLALVKQLPPQIWLHFHCRAGRGRTTTFMIMYDMIRNPHLSKKAIIDRQVALGGLDIRRLSGGLKAHKNPNQSLRNQFINLFYDYVHAPDGYGKISWSKWVMNRYRKFLDSDGSHEENDAFSNPRMASSKRFESQ